ncbi:MAG: FAD:protein FMN transferase [Gemmatimonadales bacterium]|nr:FAD:protein FMN transferase [Gemmatimonadales bacterium]
MAPVRLATAAMGTRFELVLTDGNPDHLRAAGEAALERIEELHRTLSRFEPASLLAHLRRVAPRPVPIGADLLGLLTAADVVRQASGGAFDIGAGSDGLAVDPVTASATLVDPDRSLDLGAIAKGFALDQAAAVLRDAGVERGFLHGGTSSAVAIGADWRVALDGAAAPITLSDSALGVSAAWTVRAGQRVPHVVDPRTGQTVTASRRVAVVGPNAMLADAWSTALLVLGARPAALGAEWRVWIEDAENPWQEIAP